MGLICLCVFLSLAVGVSDLTYEARGLRPLAHSQERARGVFLYELRILMRLKVLRHPQTRQGRRVLTRMSQLLGFPHCTPLHVHCTSIARPIARPLHVCENIGFSENCMKNKKERKLYSFLFSYNFQKTLCFHRRAMDVQWDVQWTCNGRAMACNVETQAIVTFASKLADPDTFCQLHNNTVLSGHKLPLLPRIRDYSATPF